MTPISLPSRPTCWPSAVLYAEVGKGGDLDWYLREQGYAERLRVLIEKAEAADGP